MALDDYDPSTALSAYFPSRDERRTARLWATEKLLHDLRAVGIVDFFEGPGSDPTELDDYGITKVWLRVSSGVTDEPGEIRMYDGAGDATQLSNWPELTAAALAAFIGAFSLTQHTSDNITEGSTKLLMTGEERTKVANAFVKNVDDSDDITQGVTKLLMTAAERAKLATGNYLLSDFQYVKLADMDAVSVLSYGAVADDSAQSANNVTDIQAAADAAVGRTLYFGPGTWYIRSLITLKSNTRVHLAAGAIVKAHVASWTGDKRIFRNENHSASALTDENIHLEGNGLIDCDGMTADTHMWYMRYVDTSSVRGCIGKGGGNFVAFLACVDTVCEGAEAQDVGNCGFDHWDGAGDAIVSNCTVRGSAAQGIQATGTATDFANRDAWNIKFIGNTIRDVTNGDGDASAIIFNTVDAGSTNSRCLSMGNYVESCDIGLVFSGLGSGRQSVSDTFYLVNQLPIFFQDDGGLPSNTRVVNPTLIDCDHDSGNVALIQLGGTNNYIEGLRLNNVGAAAYELVVWFRSDASACRVQLSAGAAGSTGYFQNNGANSRFQQQFKIIATTVALEARGAAIDMVGADAYATDGRKSGEGGGAGTGVPVWWNGTNWLTYHDNSTLAD